MAEDTMVHDDIYLFVIRNGKSGYAEYGAVYQRASAAPHEQAMTEILNGTAHTEWADVTEPCAPGGLDMRFKSERDCLVFVLIENHGRLTEKSLQHSSHTYFGRDVVTELPLRGKSPNKIIFNGKPHGNGSNYPALCSFELRMKKARDEMQNRPNSDPVSRFPIVFDFVDARNGISPVYKSLHNPVEASEANTAPQVEDMMGHGGIHPPTASSLIIIE